MKTILNILDKIIFPALLILSVFANYHLSVNVENLEDNNKKLVKKLTSIEDNNKKLVKK